MADNPIEILITIPFPAPQMDMLEEISPNLRFNVQAARKPEEISNEIWGRTEVLYTDRILPQPAQAPRLRWVQFNFAGIDFVTDLPLLRKPDLVATTLSGAAAPQAAEYALHMLLALGHHVPELSLNQQRINSTPIVPACRTSESVLRPLREYRRKR